MNSINFKVVFKGSNDIENKKLTLTFQKINSTNNISIPAVITSELKNLSEKTHNIVVFQNIKDVIEIGNESSRKLYNSYYILIYTFKSNAKKEGYLIGNVKKKGDVIIGVWPFNKQIVNLSPEEILESFSNLIKEPNDYSNISLILS
jgi:hypothetical protein